MPSQQRTDSQVFNVVCSTQNGYVYSIHNLTTNQLKNFVLTTASKPISEKVLMLARYPSHPEFMRAQASILLLMGERDKAIEIYEAVEEIESDPAVRKKLEELQKEAP